MELKVGDKVKIIHFPDRSIIGRVGAIRDVRSPFRDYPYSVWMSKTSLGWVAVREQEIEKVITKNQQLLFEFME